MVNKGLNYDNYDSLYLCFSDLSINRLDNVRGSIECSGTSWDLMEPCRTPWHVLKCLGMSWHVLEYSTFVHNIWKTKQLSVYKEDCLAA